MEIGLAEVKLMFKRVEVAYVEINVLSPQLHRKRLGGRLQQKRLLDVFTGNGCWMSSPETDVGCLHRKRLSDVSIKRLKPHIHRASSPNFPYYALHTILGVEICEDPRSEAVHASFSARKSARKTCRGKSFTRSS